MKKNKSKKYVPIAIIVIAAIGLLGISTASAHPFYEGNNKMMSFEGQQAIQEAVQNNDYEAWASLMQARITQENFNKLAEKQKEIAENHAETSEHRFQMIEKMQAIETAIKNSDYDAWYAAISDSGLSRITETINKENFPVYVQLHEAMQSRDIETAQQLSEELGLDELREACPMKEMRSNFRKHGIGMFR